MRTVIGFLAAMILALLTGCVAMPPPLPTEAPANIEAVDASETPVEETPTPTPPYADDTWTPAPSTAPTTPPEPDPSASPQHSVSQENAIEAAGNYLAFISFSRTGLIDQLEYEGYTAEEASIAVDSLGVDWKGQAAKKAQEYLDLMTFSPDGLKTQLEFEGFTPEEVAFGLTAVGY